MIMMPGIFSQGQCHSHRHHAHASQEHHQHLHKLSIAGKRRRNAGSQSSTLVIRGLALKEINIKDFFPVLSKEIGVAMLCGFVLSLFNFIRIVIVYPGNYLLAATVGGAMFCTVLMAKSIGGVLPIIATRFNMDPALMASPLITTIVDAGSLLIYLNIAKMCLTL